MKLIKEITEKSLGVSDEEFLNKKYLLKKSARAVILNNKNEISMQFVSSKGFYKLPGGGIEIGETIEEGLKREIREETGFSIKDIEEIGLIIEYKNKLNIIHISYNFIAKLDKVLGDPKYEEDEIEDGFQPIWIPYNEVLQLDGIRETVDHYEGKFVVERERTIIEEAVKIIKQ